MADTERKPTGEHGPFWENEAFWRGAAFVAPILVGVALLGGLVPLLFGPEAGFPLRTEIYARLALIGVAIVTFTTVMWRGMIATRQADQQREQIDALTRNNLADMLQKGAEMLADADKPTNVTAGIATLETVATSGNRSYATQAMELLTDHVEAHSGNGHHETMAGRAVDALNRAHARTDLVLHRSIRIKSPTSYVTGSRSTFFAGARWKGIKCVTGRHYEGGTVNPSDMDVLRQKKTFVLATAFYWHSAVQIDASSDCTGCLFVNCQIQSIQSSIFDYNIFINCNFTDTKISGTATYSHFLEQEMTGFDNHYIVNRTPIFKITNRADDELRKSGSTYVPIRNHPFIEAWEEREVISADATLQAEVFQRIDAIVEQKRQRDPDWPFPAPWR
jgi:hypothetical protein